MQGHKSQFPRPFFGERPAPKPKPTFSFDVEKELDQVVGKFEDRSGSRLQRALRVAAKVLIAAALAIAAALTLMSVLNVHLIGAQTAPAPKKPVPVHILPAK